MGDLITATIITAMLSGALFVVSLVISEYHKGWSVVGFIAAIGFLCLSVAIIDNGRKHYPIETTEPPKIDTTVVYRNGAAPDTTYTYTFNPEARLD